MQDFNVIFLPGNEREPGRFLIRLHGPLPRRGAGRSDVGAFHVVDQLAVVGNPKFSRVAGGDPEVVIAGDRRGDVAADPFAVVVPEIRDALQRTKCAGAGRRCRDRDVGHVDAGNARPNFARDRSAGVDDREAEQRISFADGVGRTQQHVVGPGSSRRGRAADEAGGGVQREADGQSFRGKRRRQITAGDLITERATHKPNRGERTGDC